MINRNLNRIFYCIVLGVMIAFSGCQSTSAEDKADKKDVNIEWIDMFNGKDLDHWIPKISKHDLGDNYQNTFRVTDGNLTVNYDGYESFDNQYGHLFYDKPFSAYYLAVEYRFIGEQAPDGPGWAWRNNGAMLHGQDPKTMLKDQDFPISIEGQILGGPQEGTRTTSNLCTPGTNVVMDGKLFTPHCVNSSSKTYRGDQWVRATFLVLKDSLIQHYLEGEVVLEYTKPQIGGGNVAPVDPAVKQDGKLLTEGYISFQSESHPIQFRKIALVDLEPIYDNKDLLERTVNELVEEEKNQKN